MPRRGHEFVASGLSSALGARPADYKPEEFAQGFLHKPFKPQALLAKVQETLSGVEETRDARV